MENKKGSNFVFIIVALILGSAILKQFDFETFSFEKPALAIIYIIVFIISIVLIIRNLTRRAER